MFDENQISCPNTKWFSQHGCVVYGNGTVRVCVAGYLVSEFATDDIYARNLAAVSLAREKKFRKGKIAQAFELSGERFRQIRQIAEEKGMDALPARHRGGSETKVTDGSRRLLFRAFDNQMNAHQAFLKYGKKTSLSYRTICRVHTDWENSRMCGADSQVQSPKEDLPSPPTQQLLLLPAPSDSEAITPVSSMIAGDQESDKTPLVSTPVSSQRNVRHVGSLLMIAMLYSFGLHEAIISSWNATAQWRDRLRTAIDAFIIALCIGEKNVEGIRRLQHSSAATLLRTISPPTANWVRRIFQKYLEDEGAIKAHLKMTETYLARADLEAEEPAVFYIDNHMRPYTGKRKLQKGWRMQDKRACEGTADYYLHDEDGRPLFRVDVPMHGTLGEWLKPITQMLRQDLGTKQRILLAFDRGGAFPKHLGSLRERSFEFVTYERGPYPEIAEDRFDQTLQLEDETLKVYEEKAELGDRKVEVRRIALKTKDERQVNVIAVSKESPQRLVEIITGRWVQENSFKHGNERWGINHLDSRKTKKYPEGHVIFNPARRRLERALRLLRDREGNARRKLARLKKANPKYAELKSEIANLVDEQEVLIKERESTNQYELLKNTELADKLVYMDTNYKTLMDTIRIACMNGEQECSSSPKSTGRIS